MPTQLEWLKFFASRPSLYPELVRRTGAKMKGRSNHDWKNERSREEATQWCATRSVSTSEGILLITGTAGTSLDRQHSDTINRAQIEQERCPVVMGGAGNLDLLFNLAEHFSAERVVETGVAYGWSSLAILLSLQQRRDARLMSIDMPYPGQNNDRYVGCVVPKHLYPQWTLIRRADRQGLPKALKSLKSIDMCHYDSDKSYAGRMWAYPLLWEYLRPGGVLVSDDINDNIGFADFVSRINVEPVIIEMPSRHRGRKFVGVIRKQASI